MMHVTRYYLKNRKWKKPIPRNQDSTYEVYCKPPFFDVLKPSAKWSFSFYSTFSIKNPSSLINAWRERNNKIVRSALKRCASNLLGFSAKTRSRQQKPSKIRISTPLVPAYWLTQQWIWNILGIPPMSFYIVSNKSTWVSKRDLQRVMGVLVIFYSSILGWSGLSCLIQGYTKGFRVTVCGISRISLLVFCIYKKRRHKELASVEIGFELY